jgi:hypothetical protein
MINVTNSLIAYCVYIFSLMYLKVLTNMIYSKKLTSKNFFKIAVISFVNQLLNSIELIRNRKHSSTTLIHSITAFLIIFNTILSLYLVLEPPTGAVFSFFWTYVCVVILYYIIYIRYLLETHAILDQDSFLKNNLTKLMILFILMFVSHLFPLVNESINILFNVIFLLVSIRSLFNTSVISRAGKANLFDESLRFTWLIGGSILITGFYMKITNFYVFGASLVLEVTISLFLLSILTILHRQRSAQSEGTKFKSIISLELTKVLILCLLRIILWKF